jgi:hypothetical protein
MAYYLTNKINTTNVRLSELYEMKGVNTSQDKTTNMRLAAQGSNTEGSHLGPGLNPWQSINIGFGFSDDRLGLDGMNSPNYSGGNIQLSWIREMDWRYTPFRWGNSKAGATAYPRDIAGTTTIYDAVSPPFWAIGNYLFFYFYAMDRPTIKMQRPSANYITGVRRTISGTNYIYVAVGRIAGAGGSGGFGTLGTPNSTANFAGVNGVVGPLNLGQGEGAPYNESSDLGGSTQHCLFYRNTSNQNKVRVVTTNTDVTTSNPTVSIGSEQGGTNHGNPIPDHGVLNMGKGVAWCGYHRGANYQRVQYVNWTSGTTFSTIGSTLLRSMSSSTTISGTGHMIKLSDEFALWFYPRRSGNTSGASRLIAVIPIESSGTNRVPALRGSTTEIATYDIGSISTQDCSAAVGSSDDGDHVYGIVCWSETSAGNDCTRVMPWKYRISANSMTFQTGNILDLGTALNGTNTYRMKTGIKCLGYNPDENRNYYELIIPQGDASGGGANQVIISQNAANSGGGALTVELTQANYFNDTSVRIVAQQTWYDFAQHDNRGWYLGYSNTIANPGLMGMIYPYIDSSNVAKYKAVHWEVTV